jgi:metal-responsive CopG/Arc/MetJ family transcriptional regulator
MEADACRALAGELNSFVHDYGEEIRSEAIEDHLNGYLARSTGN